MTIPPNPHPEQVEALALVILNSDRSLAGLPPVDSRERIPDSDGYVVNATAVLASLAKRPADDGAKARWAREDAGVEPWGYGWVDDGGGKHAIPHLPTQQLLCGVSSDAFPLYRLPPQPEGEKRP